jgi:hypothetical protein
VTTDAESHSDRKNGRNTDGRFARGNPGKTTGSRHRTTLAVEALLDGEAEALTRKAVEMALGGDMAALRLCLERIAPPRRASPVRLSLPVLETAADAVKATAALVEAATLGEVTPVEATELGKLVELHIRAIETHELEERITRLEGKAAR